MAKIKFTGEEALGRVADYVNKKLTFASTMPASPDTGTLVLYVGSDTASHIQGGIYEYDGTNWNLINSVKTIELTQDEYDSLPTAVQNNGTIYFVTDAVFPGSIVSGFYNSADGKFYEEDTFETEIAENTNVIYIELSSDILYIYDAINEEYVQVGGSGSGAVIKYVSTLPVTGIEDIIYGIKEYNSFEETIADGFLDENVLFEKEDDLSGGYVYTPAENVVLDASDDGITYKGFTSLAYDGTSDWTLTFDDTTDITLADNDTFYFRQPVDKFFAGDATNQKIIPFMIIDSKLSDVSENPVQNKVIVDALDKKQNTLTFDNTPISGSSNPVTSAGIKTALDNILISGNGGSIIKVHHTAGAAVQGDTVTASKGSYSVSSTFDVSGDAIIIGFGEIGTVTVTATNGSETGSIVINIPNFSVYTATVGYGLDYKSWLIAGGLDPSYYHSLEEVLEDEEVIRRLMTIHASVDYLASVTKIGDEMTTTVLNNDICAKWINLRDYALDTLYANEYTKAIMDEADKYGYGEWALVGQVPAMTSNTAPYGEVISSGAYSGYPAYYAFNGSTSNAWEPATSAIGTWIGYQFIAPIVVKKIFAKVYAKTTGTITWQTQGHDGSDWVNIGEPFTASYDVSATVNEININLNNDIPYSKLRIIKITQSPTFYGLVAELQFYAWQPKGNVPVMTSASAPYGTVITSGIEGSSYDAWQAFNPDVVSGWTSSSASVNYVGYKFRYPVKAKSFKIASNMQNGLVDPVDRLRKYKIQASNDESTWIDLTEELDYTGSILVPGISGTDEYRTITKNEGYYLQYRVVVTMTNSNYHAGVNRFQIYGREMKVSVPTMTSDTAPYGEAIHGGIYSADYDAYKVFDNNTSTRWNGDNNKDNNYVGYKFIKPVILKKLFYNGYKYTNPYIIQGSNNNLDWIDLSDTITLAPGIQTYDVNNSSSYLYYRILCPHATTGGVVSVYELNFFGFDYSERDWDTEHPMTYLYDHGVEPTDVITSVANTSGNTFVKEPSRLTMNKTVTNVWNMIYSTNQIDVTDYTLARAVSTDGTGINGAISLGTSNNISTGASVSYKLMATNLAPYHQYDNIASVNTSIWVCIGISTTATGNIAISEWWLEQ